MEQVEIASLIHEIDGFSGPRRAELPSKIELSLSAAIPLLEGLAMTSRGLPTRQLMHVCGFDEHRLAQWRLEHKLVQALVIRHYVADGLPQTCGFDSLSYGCQNSGLRQAFQSRFSKGFVIKLALVAASDSDCDHRTEAFLSWAEGGGRPSRAVQTLTEEEFVVQERQSIRREYRVHTVEDRVIEDLTVPRFVGPLRPGEREAPNRYVQNILDRLPAGITAGAILAWDVALTHEGCYRAIEVNIGGFHTVYNRGFNTSGFYHHPYYGCVYTARLLLFMERTYGCRISVLADAPEYPYENQFYNAVAEWKTKF
jgi:hypothetical protein